MMLYSIIMPRETNKTTVHNININDNITFFLQKDHFSFFQVKYVPITAEINTRITTRITGNMMSIDESPPACFSLNYMAKNINEPNTITLKYTDIFVILKHVKKQTLRYTKTTK